MLTHWSLWMLRNTSSFHMQSSAAKHTLTSITHMEKSSSSNLMVLIVSVFAALITSPSNNTSRPFPISVFLFSVSFTTTTQNCNFHDTTVIESHSAGSGTSCVHVCVNGVCIRPYVCQRTSSMFMNETSAAV